MRLQHGIKVSAFAVGSGQAIAAYGVLKKLYFKIASCFFAKVGYNVIGSGGRRAPFPSREKENMMHCKELQNSMGV